MSVRWMTQVWERAELEGSSLLLLLAIADHANDEGVCWPSVSVLARKARLSERQTQRVLAQLEQAGYIQRDTTGGRGNKAVYTLQDPDIWNQKGDVQASPLPPAKDDTYTSPFANQKGDIQRAKRLTSQTKRVTSSAQKGDMPPHTREEPSREPSREPSGEPSGEPERAAAAAPPAPAAPEPPAPKDHPAVQAYREFNHRWPSAGQMQVIAQRDPPLEGWLRAMRAWVSRGYKPTNVDGMLEWAFNPALMERRGTVSGGRASPPSKIEQNVAAVDAYFARLEREGIQ